MKELILSFNTVLAAAGGQLQNPNQRTAVEYFPPIAGQWEAVLTKKVGDCAEIYNFKANNQFTVKSHEEWTSGRYIIVPKKDQKLPLFVLNTLYDDNNMDCSGKQEDQTGDVFPSFLKVVNTTQFELCVDADGQKCFLQFNKILP